MDIHKPKPWHGWREFLKEYGIIVLGVLTALGFEQVVETIHWRHEAEAAREVFRRDDLRILEWVGASDASGVCVNRRLTDLKGMVDAAEVSGRLSPMGDVPKPPTMPWFMRGWESAVSSGVLPHLRRGEGARYAAMQNGILALIRTREDSLAQWALLGSMSGGARRVGDAEIAALRGAIQKARVDAVVGRTSADALALMINDTGLISQSEALAAWQAGVDRGRTEPSCLPLPPPPGLGGTIPALAAPPKPPIGSYDQSVTAFRDTVVR